MCDRNGALRQFDVSGKIAIITGGLGQLGTQYAKSLLEAGARVAIFDINTNRLNEFYLNKKDDLDLRVYNVDITRRESIEKGLAAVIEELGSPSILINNAALDTPPDVRTEENATFEDYPEKAWDKTLEVNLKGAFLMCQVVGAHMAQGRGGSIINISSVYGNVSPDQRIYEYRAKDGSPFVKPASYSVAKSGIINFTRYLATYWAQKNVRVNVLSLGGVYNNQDRRFVEGYSKRVPLGRMANEDEYNGAILFLASEASSYMTGSNIVIDGGLTAW